MSASDTPTPPSPPGAPTPARRLRLIWGAMCRSREELSFAARECRDAGLEVRSLQMALADVATLESGFQQLMLRAEEREAKERGGQS